MKIPFIEKTYWNKIQRYGNLDCIISNYLWDVENACCISKDKVYEIDINKYIPLTRERLYY